MSLGQLMIPPDRVAAPRMSPPDSGAFLVARSGGPLPPSMTGLTFRALRGLDLPFRRSGSTLEKSVAAGREPFGLAGSLTCVSHRER